jgi:serine protease
VSTFPTDVTASAQASARVDYAGRARTTIDPDDYRGGFATWSGTSFAAPVLAGEIAAAIAARRRRGRSTGPTAVARGRARMSAVTEEWKETP